MMAKRTEKDIDMQLRVVEAGAEALAEGLRELEVPPLPGQADGEGTGDVEVMREFWKDVAAEHGDVPARLYGVDKVLFEIEGEARRLGNRFAQRAASATRRAEDAPLVVAERQARRELLALHEAKAREQAELEKLQERFAVLQGTLKRWVYRLEAEAKVACPDMVEDLGGPAGPEAASRQEPADAA